jgi:hypothetical protein
MEGLGQRELTYSRRTLAKDGTVSQQFPAVSMQKLSQVMIRRYEVGEVAKQ